MKPTTTKKALVLSGGSFAGGAWMRGLIDALRDDGVDLGVADLIVGTSAGARTGAQLAIGALSHAVDMHRRSGAHSLHNADLAAGHDIVTVLSPIPVNEYLQGKLDAEIVALGAATVHVIVADQASLAAIGPIRCPPRPRVRRWTPAWRKPSGRSTH